MKPLKDLTRLKLSGYSLIEASAGTGKTFTITGIYLRLVMEEALMPEDILVVTFTNAATEELRAKIRKRLEDALGYLGSTLKDLDQQPDEVLRAVVEHAVKKVGEDEAKRRLRLALLGMDQAAVFTIHGFCQRVLREFSFEAKAGGEPKDVVMEEELYLPACREFLRSKVSRLEEDFLSVLIDVLSTRDPAQFLFDKLEELLRLPEPVILPKVDLDSIRKEYALFKKKQKEARRVSGQIGKALKKETRLILQDLLAELAGHLEKGLQEKIKTNSKKWISTWVKKEWEAFDDLISRTLPEIRLFESASNSVFFACALRESLPKKIWLRERLFEKVIKRSSLKQGKKLRGKLPLDHASYNLFKKAVRCWLCDDSGEEVSDEVRERIAGLLEGFYPLLNHFGIRERLVSCLLYELREFSRAYLEGKKREIGAISYDDMLKMVHKSLTGPGGKRLCRLLSMRYKVAMIDEFQDTDAIQWEIFSSIYDDSERSRLFLIGDPKQAIYGFRGADIFTYLKAKEKTRGSSRWDLDTNWRSSPPLVEGVNTIFSQAENPFVLEGIDFLPVRAREENNWRLKVLDSHGAGSKGHAWPDVGIEFWVGGLDAEAREESALSKEVRDDNQEEIDPARVTASKIASLLSLSQEGRLVMEGPQGERKAVEAGDIAVLVRSHYQAGKVRDALYDLGIYSIYYGPSNIFESIEARELLYILNALISPFSQQAVSTALCTTVMGFDAEGLLRVQRDEERWEGIVNSFSELRQLWNKKGIMVALRAFFYRFDVPRRLLSLSDGQRRLTNLRQLAELLSEAEREHPGPSRLLLWLKKAIDDPGLDQDEKRLRLETDENLVKVMTYHMSKGLEFPIVFLPYIGELGIKCDSLSRFYSSKRDAYVLPVSPASFVFDREGRDGRARFVLSQEEEQFALSQARAEEVRLAYVAFTRAKCKMFVGLFEEDSSGSIIWDLFLAEIKEGLGDDWPKGIKPGRGLVEKGEVFKEVASKELPEMVRNRMLTNAENVQNLKIWCKEQENFSGSVEKHSKIEGDKGALLRAHLERLFPREKGFKILWRRDLEDVARGAKRVSLVRGHFGRVDLPKTASCPLVKQSWGRTSFTGLSSTTGEDLEPITLHESPDLFSEASGMAAFPRGPEAGSCVHKIFEEVDFRGSLHDFKKEAEKALNQYDIDPSWANVLADMVNKVVSSELKPGLRLNLLNPKKIVKEMDFHWACGEEFWESVTVSGLELKKGVIKGYIDLVFEHNGRFYLLDYKTNWLGLSPEDYVQKNLERAMDQHNYWLQAALYAGALDSYLSTFKQGYRREEHFGGVFYLFVRGMTGEDESLKGTGVIFISPKELKKRYTWLFRQESEVVTPKGE